jgi:opacity protein-like surface antigen
MEMGKKLFVCAMILMALAAVAIAADVAGTWTASFDTQVGPQMYTYTFKVAGGKLTGTAKSNLGEGPVEGTVTGDDIAFVEHLNYQGMTLDIPYKGKISGDEIKFTRTIMDIAEELVAKRAK